VKKSNIRKKLLNLRKNNYSKSLSINPNNFLKFLKKKNIKLKTIGGYYPFNYELDIMNILKIFEKKNFILSLPRIAQNNRMDFFQWSFKDPLKINKYGIPETISKKKVYPQILLIPLVAFDNQLNRLGYGGGYYDRYISRFHENNKIIKIGIGFSFQKVKKLPTNKFDKKLDFIITEKDFIK
jgi:5-formyltetrahydrofolate cyclo-ligase